MKYILNFVLFWILIFHVHYESPCSLVWNITQTIVSSFWFQVP